MLSFLTQLKIPGQDTLPTPPKGIPDPLKGGLDTSGANFLQLIINYLFIIGVILALIFLMYAGVSFITSGGDSMKMAAAKKKLIYALIGLVIIAGAFFIVRFIITALGGDSAPFLQLKGIS